MCVGCSLHRSGTAVLPWPCPRGQGCRCTPQDGTSGPGKDMCVGQTGWRAPGEAHGERTAVPAAGRALSHSQFSWGRVNTRLEHPAVPA